MNMPSFKKSTACIVIITHMAAFTLPSAQAAPGTLASAPLYLSTAVEPNIMFLLDDSGSMEWEFLAQGANDGIPSIGNLNRYYVLPSANNGQDQYYPPDFPYTVPSVTLVADAWRARSSSFNALYYNPSIVYEPWDGVDATGAALYTNATPTAARVNPNNAAAGTLNLTATINFKTWISGWIADSVFPAHYYLWTDTNTTPALNGNGIVDATDTNVLVEIKPTTVTYTKASTRSDCAGVTCTYAEEIQNFANWYTYHRKRAYAAKKAVGSLIDKSSGTRMGLYTYNNGLIKNAASMNTAANKLALLQSTYSTAMICDPTGCPSTPARTALKALGDLFEGGSSPILTATTGGTCQQNFSMVVTDGYWNGGSPGVGNTDTDGAGTFDGAPYADTYSDTLADVAMHYYERDLKTGLANKVPTTAGVDNADHQHMVTYTVAFGVIGTLNPATADPKATGFVWPDPTAGDNQKIDDTWHAAYNGRGKFLSAQDPAKLAIAATSVIADIEERSSSAAAVAFNSTSLNQNSVIYQAQFNTVKWSGELLAFALDPNNGNITSTTPIWNAGTQLNSQSPNSRVILTYNPTTNTGIPFTWDTSALSVTQQADLNRGIAAADGKGAERVAYLRGDRTHENPPPKLDFRKRSSNTVLGDIAHSNPVYVGEANLLYPDTAPFPTGSSAYSVFKASKASRPGVIYVGANDGMLHGFSAATGNEVLAYIPHNLFSANTSEGLHYLTEKTYGHRYYVDLGTTISDAFIASVPGGTVDWKTVLIGSERGGGRGVFALDVTNPSSFSQSGTAPDDIVMWEFTHADLGYTFSKPAVALMKNGRWAAIFGNGYNDTGDGKAKLFIVYLDGGLDGVWSAGTDYLTITTDVGSTSARNGLASPNMIDTNADKVVDRIYAGDLEGNIWVFDVSSTTDTSWGVAYKSASAPKPLFTAKNAAGTVQPITSKPSVARHVSVANATSNLPNLMVYFGTGQYIATGDTTSTATQTFYGIWDSGLSSNQLPLLRANLTPQTITTTATRTVSNTAVAYTASGASQRFGWYIDLNASNATTGERVVVDSLVRGNEVYFNTLIPNNVPCSFGGSGWSMRVNRDNGGIPGAPVFDTDGNGIVNGSDNVNVTGEFVNDAIMTESKILGNTAYISTSDGKILQKKVPKIKSAETGRQSWREIIR